MALSCPRAEHRQPGRSARNGHWGTLLIQGRTRPRSDNVSYVQFLLYGWLGHNLRIHHALRSAARGLFRADRVTGEDPFLDRFALDQVLLHEPRDALRAHP